METQIVLAVGIPAVSALAWLFGKIATLETRVGGNEAATSELRDDVKYIRRRVDEWMDKS